MKKIQFLACLCVFALLAVPSAHAVFTPIPPDQLDFYEHYNTLYSHDDHMYCLVACPDDDNPLARQMNPATADINGPFEIPSDPREIVLVPNGMLDCNYEMAMIASVLKKPAGWYVAGPYGQGANRDQLTLDWEFNLARLRSDLQGAATLMEMAGGAMVPHLYAIMNAFVVVGDGGSCSFVQGIFGLAADLAVGTFDPANYRRHPELFGPTGDADRDGYSNYAEYVTFGPSSAKGPAEFLEASLDPTIMPAGEPDMADSDGDGLLDSQEDLNGNGVVDEGETDPQETDTDGDGVADGMERLVWGSDPATADDKPEVPALGLLGLAALGGLIGAYGAKRMR
jgi:hypothetical protein